MGAKTINEIITSPFFASEIIHSFICGYKNDMDYSILYLVLPVIYNGECRKKLNTAKSSSSIYSLFTSTKKYYGGQITLNSKIDLYNIFDNQQKLIPLTKKAIVILSSKNKINLLPTGKLSNKNCIEIFKKCKEASIKPYLKAAYYFGVILSKNSVQEFLELTKGV